MENQGTQVIHISKDILKPEPNLLSYYYKHISFPLNEKF